MLYNSEIIKELNNRLEFLGLLEQYRDITKVNATDMYYRCDTIHSILVNMLNELQSKINGLDVIPLCDVIHKRDLIEWIKNAKQQTDNWYKRAYLNQCYEL